jgi:hypothetical protein
MKFEILKKDGTAFEMTLCMEGTTPAAEIAMWPAEHRAELATDASGGWIITQVEAFAPRVTSVPAAVAAVPSSALGEDVKAVMIEMAEAMATATRANAALEGRIAALEGTIKAVGEAV